MTRARSRADRASLNALLGAADPVLVRQGVELLRALDDAALWDELATGISVDAQGCLLIAPQAPVRRRVRAAFRVEVALWVLGGSAKGREVHEIALDGVGEGCLEAAAHVPALRTLRVRACAFADLAPLANAAGLRSLHVVGCTSLVEFVGPAGRLDLHTLDVGGCTSLAHLDELRACTSLRRLRVWDAPALTDIDGVRGCTALQDLELRGCAALARFDALATLAALESLTMRACPGLRDLGPLAGLTQLRALDLRACSALRDIDALAVLEHLAWLDLRGCAALPGSVTHTDLEGDALARFLATLPRAVPTRLHPDAS